MKSLMDGIHLLIGSGLCLAALVGCGGGGDNAPANPVPSVLLAGQSVTLTSGETINVPKGTVISGPGGNIVNLSGDNNTVNTSAGAIVSAPASATGPADNVVIAK